MTEFARVRRMRERNKSRKRFIGYKDNHRQSWQATGQPCKCGHNHQSINILDDKNGMTVIEENICPMMYGMRNACLRAWQKGCVPQIDFSLLIETTRVD